MNVGTRDYRLPVAFLIVVTATTCRPDSSGEPPLLSLAAVRDLSDGRAVRVRGVLGLYDEAAHAGYLQDGTAGLYLEAPFASSVPAAGRGVEISGTVARRGGAAFLRAQSFHIVPLSEPTPEPRRLPVAALADPGMQGVW